MLLTDIFNLKEDIKPLLYFQNDIFVIFISSSQDKVKNVSHDISDLEKELDAMKAPGREIKTVKAQLDDLARYYKRLELADDLVAESAKAAEALVDSGFAESAKARDQVSLVSVSTICVHSDPHENTYKFYLVKMYTYSTTLIS